MIKSAQVVVIGNNQSTTTKSISLSDSGSGTDSLTSLAAILALADAGSGVDSVSALAAALALADSGHGTDSVSITVALTVVDSGLGADSFLGTMIFPLTDSGTGVDSVNVDTGSIKNLTDSGQGVDSVVISVTIDLADAGAGIEGLGLHWFLVDSGVGVDKVGIVVTYPQETDIYFESLTSSNPNFNIKNIARSQGSIPNHGTWKLRANVPLVISIFNIVDKTRFSDTLTSGTLVLGNINVPLTLVPGTVGIFTGTPSVVPGPGPIAVKVILNTIHGDHFTIPFSMYCLP